jgi:hypothetical protein
MIAEQIGVLMKQRRPGEEMADVMERAIRMMGAE